MKKKVIISVDAGGSSTRYFVIGPKKEVLDSYKTGSGSPAVNLNAEEDIFQELKKIVKNMKKEYHLQAIVIGMSGFALVNEPLYYQKLKEEFKVPILLENDAILALNSVLQEKYECGAVVISGTGAIILAKNQNQFFYANGWGELLTERGSGYAMVKDFVCNMIHHNEQRGYYSPLEQQFLDFLGFKAVEEFKMLFYRHKKNEVAKLCDFFVEEARKNNEEAKKWLYDNGILLGIDLISALTRVGLTKDGKYPIGFRGGFLEGNPDTVQGLLDKLSQEGYQPLVAKEEAPIFGGYYQAKKNGYL